MTPEAVQGRPRRDNAVAERSFDSLTNPANVSVPPPGETGASRPPARRAAGQATVRSSPVRRRSPATHRAVERETPAGPASGAIPIRPATEASEPPSGAIPVRPAPVETAASAASSRSKPARPPASTPPAAQASPGKVEAPPLAPDEEEVAAVRPFVVTRGRTQASTDTRLESILEVANQQWLADKGKSLSPEELAIVRQIATTYLTVAEVSAHLKLPVGVVKVLVSDLAESGVLMVHDTVAGSGGINSQGPVSREQTLELLESVLNAISEL
ncbi:MAG: DUF742 domain-containing protein [Bifidobacteriaceae bacterium]|nr:DUF742 domain-containing protein [Bifidobacteriaceae bacterium]